MAAIYKREFRYFFHSFIGWIYSAAMLFLMGIYFTICNMLMGYPTVSYVLQSVVFLVVITVPILTMRSLAEERKYKTDQLILTAPISVGRIVLGKYLALVTVFAIPLFIIGLTPLTLMRIGEFQVGLSYTSLLGFFLYGCLGLAVGLFVSSLTESVVIAAVLTLIVMFVGYIMAGICGLISTSGTTAFADIVTKILYCFDMVGRFDTLSSGYFRVEAVVYYVTFTAFVLFCTAQSIQKRRYAMVGVGIKLGAYSIFNIIVAAALTILINVGVSYIPEQYVSYDVTVNKIFTLTEDTVQFVSNLSQDVTIYVLVDEASKDQDLDNTLRQVKGYSDHIRIEYVSPTANPMFYYKYTDTQPTDNSLIIAGPSMSAVVDYNDIFAYELNYSTYNYEVVGYDGEGQIVAGLTRATLENIPKFYAVSGHDELELEERFLNALYKENLEYDTLRLYTVDAVPEDAYGIILDAPINDYSADDRDKILDYLAQGGNALIILPLTDASLDNFRQVVEYYGVTWTDGLIVEQDRGHYYQSPYDLFPNMEYNDITESVYSGAVFSPQSIGLIYDEESEDVRYRPLLTTSDDAFSKTNFMNLEDVRKSEEDIDGPFVIALQAEKLTESGEMSQAVIVSSERMFTSLADEIVPGYNVTLFGSMLASLADREDSTLIPVKYYEIGNLIFSARTVYVTAFVSVIMLPAGCLLSGLIIWLRRRKR